MRWNFGFKVKMIVVAIVAAMVTGCAPSRTFFMNSEGIVSYNRHTGQLEMVWDAKTGQQTVDSVQPCKCKAIQNH